MPYNVAAEIPSVGLQRERETPGHAQQIFILHPRWIVWTHGHGAIGILLVRRAPPAVSAGEAVANIQPQNAVRFENSAHLGKNARQLVNVSGESWFETDLTVDAVVAEPPVSRR